jgi:hypothetical protein
VEEEEVLRFIGWLCFVKAMLVLCLFSGRGVIRWIYMGR